MDKRTLLSLFAGMAGTVCMLPRASGQTLSVGIIGGGSLTNAVRDVTTPATVIPAGPPLASRSWSPSKDWIAGAMLELRFRPQFSVEVDGMYRLLHATWAGVMPDGTLNSVSPSHVVTWEFPVMAKYRLDWERFKPFVEAGPAFRTTGNLNFTPSHFGGTVGLGAEARWRGLAIAPALRYTRWAPDSTAFADTAHSRLNQLELLVAFSHEAESRWRPAGGRVSLGAELGWGLNPDLGSSSSTYYFDYMGVNITSRGTALRSSIVGPSIEVHVLQGFSVEVDALHKALRTHTEMTFDNGARPYSSTDTSATVWQFPVLAKYGFRAGRVRPFAEAGPSFRLPQWNLSTHGVTAGAGVALRVGALKVSPTIRFTHWGRDTGWGGSGVARNEASALVGLSFGGPG